MLNEILKDRAFTSSEQIEEVMTPSLNDRTCHDTQGVFRNWTSRLTWVIENEGEYTLEQIRIHLDVFHIFGDWTRSGIFFSPVIDFGEQECESKFTCDITKISTENGFLSQIYIQLFIL
jgi:hypothetical protein